MKKNIFVRILYLSFLALILGFLFVFIPKKQTTEAVLVTLDFESVDEITKGNLEQTNEILRKKLSALSQQHGAMVYIVDEYSNLICE